MLARSRHITLRNGIELETPLLIPALSSVAMDPILYPHEPRGEPALTPCSLVHSETLLGAIEETILISAYDMHYGLLKDCEAFRSGFARSRYGSLRFIIIDSGWYERQKHSSNQKETHPSDSL